MNQSGEGPSIRRTLDLEAGEDVQPDLVSGAIKGLSWSESRFSIKREKYRMYLQ